MAEAPAAADTTSERRPGQSAAIVLFGVVAVPVAIWPGLVDPYAAPKLAVLSLVMGAALVGLAVRSADRGDRPLERLGLPIALAYLSWNVLSFIVAGPDRQGFYGERFLMQGLWSTFLYVAAWWAGARLFRTTDARSMLLRAATAGTAIVALVALGQVLTGNVPSSGIFAGRAIATIGQPNALGAFLVMGIPLALGVAFAGRSARERWLGAAAAAVSMLGAVTTGSRGALIAAAAAALVGAVVLRRTIGRRTAIRLALVVLTAVLAAIAVPGVRDVVTGTVDRVASAEGITRDPSTRQHLDLWAVAVSVVADHPILGIGPERFPTVFPVYRDRVLSEERAAQYVGRRAESPHDVYLAVAVAGGVPALALYLSIIALGLRGLFGARTRPLRDGPPSDRERLDGVVAASMGLAVAAHLVADLFMSAELSSSWLGWLLLGAGVGSVRTPSGVPAVGEARAD